MRVLCAATVAAGLVLTGCASTPRAGATAGQRSQTALLEDEVRSTQYTNLFDVIQALRSNWLSLRAPTGGFSKPVELQVYLDQQRLGGIQELRSVQVITVKTVRYLDPNTASARYGLDHGAGVILIQTLKQ
jgi:hypothetical protein